MANTEDLSFFESADELDAAKKSAALDPSQAQFLVFSVAGVELAVGLSYVLEIVPYERVCALPGAPRSVRGVVHLRGRVIPVMDLAIKLGRPPASVTKRTCILMLEVSQANELLPVGVVMDGLAKLCDVDAKQIKRAPRFGSDEQSSYSESLIATEHGMLPVIDVTRVFARDDLAQLAQIADRSPQDA